MSKLDVEEIKRASHGLRGSIPEELASASDGFDDPSVQLLKFHGIYQQLDRDQRKASRDGGAAPERSFMLRTKSPGGFLPATFYLAVDELADRFGNGTIRLTTRGAIQLHGVRKRNLKTVIGTINQRLGSTLGACGDINRNVMAPAFPFASPAYRAARQAAFDIAAALTPVATAYYEVWQDGEVVHSSKPATEPIYGETFLPRKFKIAVTVPGDNSVDLYTNDIGVVAIVDPTGAVTAYDLTVGGGLGMTHNKPETYPRLADAFGSVPPDRLLDAVRAIVLVQRDNGDRTNRRHARLKYLIADRGLAWFRGEVERRAGFALDPWIALPPWTVPSYVGWQEQGDGRWFYALHVLSGRIRDTDALKTKTALREIVSEFGFDLVATPDQDLIITDVLPEQRAGVEAIFARYGVAPGGGLDLLERRAMACPALPTCGLSLAESERVLPAVLAAVRAAWSAARLDDDALPTVRMTGCPNGCARPYVGEIGLVGVSLDRYNVSLGGNPSSTRLNVVFREKVRLAELGEVLTPVFAAYAADRAPGESFGDFAVRYAAAIPA